MAVAAQPTFRLFCSGVWNPAPLFGQQLAARSGQCDLGYAWLTERLRPQQVAFAWRSHGITADRSRNVYPVPEYPGAVVPTAPDDPPVRDTGWPGTDAHSL